MNSEFQILLSGVGIPNFYPIGASVSYGINRIPIATVQVGPKALPLFCNFDAYRRKPVVLTIKSVDGCIQFNGIIDGFSISQQPGSLTTSLIIKHPFTYLNEVYPRILGLNAGGSNVFAVNQPFQVNPSGLSSSLESTSNGNILADFQQLYGYQAQPGTLAMNVNVIDFIVGLAKTIVSSQTFSAGLTPMGEFANSANALSAVMAATDLNKRVLAPAVMSLLDNIDTSYCAGMTLAANAPNIADRIIRDAGFLQDTLFNSLVKLVSEYGCCLIVGNSKSYIIPEAAYLKIPKVQNLVRGVKGNAYNVVMPSEYVNFSFSDSGENTIKGVYVIDDPQTSLNTMGASSTGVLSGSYIDPAPDVFGNIVVRTLPNFATIASAYAAGVGSLGIHTAIANQNYLVNGKISYDESLNAIQQVQATINNNAILPAQEFLNQWAELEYCKIKYDDRTGNFNSYFNNVFVPGAVGSIYTRQPGAYVDFYVSTVTHSFSVSPPANGSADTSVSFRCGRAGAATYNGLDRLALYDYGYSNSLSFCQDFITNISGT